MADEGWHEVGLSDEAQDMHRAIRSAMEELEAVDWYHQRADVTGDAALRDIMIHNRNEEMEHFAMSIEWLRRRYPDLDAALRLYLFSEGDITQLEEEATGDNNDGPSPGPSPGSDAGQGGLGIGNLR